MPPSWRRGGVSDDDVHRIRRAVESRLSQMDAMRLSWQQTWRLLQRYIQPRLGRFNALTVATGRGARRDQQIINNTATLASQRFAAGLMGGASSPASPWFKLRIGDKRGNPHPDAKWWCDEVENRVNTVLSEGNFYRSVAQSYEEIGVFGTAAMGIYEDFDDVVRFYPWTVGEFFCAVDARGEVSTLYRKFTKTVGELVDEFGRECCSQTVRAAWDVNQLANEIIVCQAIEPNDDRVQGIPGWRGMPYREVVWEYGSASACMLRTRGFHEKPFVCPRWNVTSNDPYGRSPGMDALGDVLQVQSEEREKAKAIQKVNNPPMVGDARLRNEPASVIPGGVTWVVAGQSGVGDAFRPAYQINPNIEHYAADIARIEQRIKSTYFEDLFLMIAEQTKDMTAYEVAQRKEEKMLMLGPPLERLQNELHRPVIERVFALMDRAGLIPDAPASIGGQHVSVEFVSVLAHAQKATATVSIERTFAFAGSIAGVKPEVMDNIDVDAAIEDYADLIGAPAKMLTKPEMRDAIRKQRAQQMAAQQAMQAGLAATQAASNLSNVDVGGGMNAVQAMIGGGMGAAQQRPAANAA